MAADFATNLARGLLGESLIAQWLIGRGAVVVPAYEVEIGSGKGPRVFAADGPLVAPDLGVIRGGRFFWVEAKHKSVFSWRRQPPGPRWETGIDLPHWLDYCRVAAVTGLPVWLMFLHRESAAAAGDRSHLGPGAACPVGLFGISIKHAERTARLDRVSRRHAHRGMAYWGLHDLRLLAPLSDVVSGGV